MDRAVVQRTFAVSIAAVSLIVASQVLAGMEPPRPGTQLGAGTEPADVDGVTTTAVTTATTVTPPTPPPTTALPPITGPVRLDERSKLDGRGVGTVEAGMTVAEAEQAAGRRFEIVDRADAADNCFGAVPSGLVGLRFAVEGPVPDPREGRIVRVDASDVTWATASDVRVGSPVDEIRRSYGNRAKATADGKGYTVAVSDAGRDFAVLFVTSERGVVAAIRSGEAAAVQQPDGCG